jgi:diguanylate cyclase (GGDEF)-like protein/PAS domain S-box-containing protein
MALLLGGLCATLGLWWALRSAASRQALAASMAMDLSLQARESEARLRAVLDNTVDGLVTLTPRGTILSVNRAVCHIFGYVEEDLLGQHLSKLLPDASGPDGGKPIDTFLAGQRIGIDGVGHRSQGRRANGMRFPIDLAMSSMTFNGQVQHIGLVRDLSKQDAADRAIVEAHRQLNEVDEMRRVIIHSAPYAIFVLNAQGIIQTVNPAGEKLVGYGAGELVGRCTTQRFFDADQVSDRARMLALRMNQPVQDLDVLRHLSEDSPGLPSEWNMRRADGSYLVGEITVTELRTEFGQLSGYLLMAYDVTSRRDAEHQLQHMAQHDALTALPNRNMLQEHLKTCMTLADRYGHNMAMMFLDLDRFKKINDGLGHQVGDAVLIEVARRLRTHMRTSDIVARLGGDEFVVLLPQITAPEDGEHVAQKVMALFTEPLSIEGRELRVTPSIGLAIYPAHGADTVTLMRHADLAMYQAKSLGRNRIQVYSDQMASPTVETLVLENDLYKALERDELRLHFQPQFDCASGRITGAEALMRWEHGGRLVPPSDFIPTAEETGLILPMGEWVLRRACIMAQQWRERSGWPMRVSVNLSAVQLDQQDVPAMVARVLQETGLPPTALELEITESVVVRESLRAADILTQLRAQGVSIAIDDFGVGYSSFAYLRELPVDRLKLDRSFLTSVPLSPGDSRLVAALIAMGHRLDVGIVAEGVETHEQAAFLVAHGCDEAQGYYLGRPMKEEAFEALLMEHSREHKAFATAAMAGSASATDKAASPITTVAATTETG